METIQVEYNASVMVPAGWRGVTITATAEKISEKRCQIVEVLDIDGLGNAGYGSRTGANRQKFHIGGVAKREEGKVKNLSSCTVKAEIVE